ncbi:hypothetical protein TNCV_3201151 [Trichonephila clavipes]|nr:hypothetical protein TNCV_3201151 [Trichonephila clavipes]
MSFSSLDKGSKLRGPSSTALLLFSSATLIKIHSSPFQQKRSCRGSLVVKVSDRGLSRVRALYHSRPAVWGSDTRYIRRELKRSPIVVVW